MQPTIVVLSAPIFFKEKLIVRKGILFSMGAAVLYAAVIIRNKKLPGIDAYQKTIVQLVSAAIVLLPYLTVTGDVAKLTLGTTGLIMLLIVGFLHTGVAYALYFGSMEGLKAQSIAYNSFCGVLTICIY